MKRNELISLLDNLEKVKNLTGVKFNYILDKNKKLIQQEIEDMQKQAEPNEKFQDYEKKRLELLTKFAEKEKDGSPKFEQSGGMVRFDIPEKEMKKFQEEMNKLIDEFKPEITARDKQLIEYDKFLQEKIDLKFHLLKLEDISNDITGEQFEAISVFVEEE